MVLQQQQQQQPPFETDIGVRDCYDSEVRDRPPKTPPKSSHAFDYYGNPISQQQEENPHQLQRHIQQQYHHQDASHFHVVPHQPPASAQPWGTAEDYSEFLVEPLVASRQSTQPNGTSDEVYDRGCVAEFGQCLKVSLCCTPNEHDLAADMPLLEKDKDFPMEGLKMAREQRVVMQEINDELTALRQSLVSAKTSRAMLEFELRSELADIRRQKADMEEAYRREIAREISEKAILQAKLQSKLLTMMEERMRVEIQLDRLSIESSKLLLQNGEGQPISGGSLGNNTNDPKSCCGGALNRAVADTSTDQSGKQSPISALGYLPSTPVLQSGVAAAAAAAIDGDDDAPQAVSGNHTHEIPQRKGIEPPIQESVRTPIDPVSFVVTAPLISSNIPTDMLNPPSFQNNNNPFGLPIVAENPDNNSGTPAKNPQSHPEDSVVGSSPETSRCSPAEVSE